MSVRYVYARPRPGGRRRGRGPRSAWEVLEVPADLVRASAELTPAARAAAEAARPPTPAGFGGLSQEDVASVFAAHERREVTISGGRYTREPTLWNLVRRRP